jgi:hypothetical protein
LFCKRLKAIYYLKLAPQKHPYRKKRNKTQLLESFSTIFLLCLSKVHHEHSSIPPLGLQPSKAHVRESLKKNHVLVEATDEKSSR